LGKSLGHKSSKNIRLESLLEKNTLNVVFYSDSFVKTRFFVKMMSEWDSPIFYFDFDLLYSGYATTGETSLPKNITILSPGNDNLLENLKSVISKISKTKSLIVLDSLNGFFNLLEDKNDAARLINSFIMLLTSTAKDVKSRVIIGSLSKLNDENKWILYNTGRHELENDHMTRIQLVGSDTGIVAKMLNPDNLILEI
tara:strand:+ start:1013 stop:1606 length:594 start_codon:yes stop_codon:yes gene_type:complete